MSVRYVYTLIADDGEVLYVGCTNHIARRLTNHASGREWFPEVARIEVDRYPDEASGLAAERAAIKSLNPTHNRVFTDHTTPRRIICSRCRTGGPSGHKKCLGVNRLGETCPCRVCARMFRQSDVDKIEPRERESA